MILKGSRVPLIPILKEYLQKERESDVDRVTFLPTASAMK